MRWTLKRASPRFASWRGVGGSGVDRYIDLVHNLQSVHHPSLTRETYSIERFATVLLTSGRPAPVNSTRV
jgi:hypothetical protein